MKILAIIPARADSKRLPNKNKLPLGGKPLIVWTIEAAAGIPEICDVLVSTDDLEIADISKNVGAFVPWERPIELATDDSTSIDVALHALDWYEKEKGQVNGILLLQPTSPLRTSKSIKRAIAMFITEKCKKSIVSIGIANSHPAWCFMISGNLMIPFQGWDTINKRSQELEPAWSLNGSIYLISPERLRQDKNFLSPDARPLIIEDAAENIDIDTIEDFLHCEMYITQKSMRSNFA